MGSDAVNFEKLYSPSQWNKRFTSSEEVLTNHWDFIDKKSQLARKNIPCQLNIAYGPSPRDKFDVYGTDLDSAAPTLIHIHGGYYAMAELTHTNNGFVSTVPYKNGIRSIILSYELAPVRTLREILANILIGLRKSFEYAKSLGSKSIILSGHSVGAHGIACVLNEFLNNLSIEDRQTIKATLLICGIYDFIPITKMSANEPLKLTEKIAQEEFSPQFTNQDFHNTMVFVVVAENDSPAYVQQSKDYSDKLKADGTKCTFMLIPEVDHFNIMEKLLEEDYELNHLILKSTK